MSNQPVQKVERPFWHNDHRYARLTCGHSVEVNPRVALPESVECPECPPVPEAEPPAPPQAA